MIRQPDGTLACLPEWMISPRAATFEVRDVPVLPIRALSALRAVVDALFLSETRPTRGPSDDGKAKDGGAGGPVSTGRSGTSMSPEQRENLIGPVSALILEVMTHPDTAEGDEHDSDHR